MAHLTYINCRLLKIITHGRESIFVTIYYIWLKYYLSFCLFAKSNMQRFKLVADGMRSFKHLAIALNSFKELTFNQI